MCSQRSSSFYLRSQDETLPIKVGGERRVTLQVCSPRRVAAFTVACSAGQISYVQNFPVSVSVSVSARAEVRVLEKTCHRRDQIPVRMGIASVKICFPLSNNCRQVIRCACNSCGISLGSRGTREWKILHKKRPVIFRGVVSGHWRPGGKAIRFRN